MAKARQNLLKRVRQERDEAKSVRLVLRMSEKKRKRLGLNKFGESSS